VSGTYSTIGSTDDEIEPLRPNREKAPASHRRLDVEDVVFGPFDPEQPIEEIDFSSSWKKRLFAVAVRRYEFNLAKRRLVGVR
jgi:hypothetical protein